VTHHSVASKRKIGREEGSLGERNDYKKKKNYSLAALTGFMGGAKKIFTKKRHFGKGGMKKKKKTGKAVDAKKRTRKIQESRKRKRYEKRPKSCKKSQKSAWGRS